MQFSAKTKEGNDTPTTGQAVGSVDGDVLDRPVSVLAGQRSAPLAVARLQYKVVSLVWNSQEFFLMSWLVTNTPLLLMLPVSATELGRCPSIRAIINRVANEFWNGKMRCRY